jgi:hypothetical protein
MKVCWFCGTEVVLATKIARKDICSKCKMSLKCCRNCGFFDPSAPRQCREPAAEDVRDKDAANFCEYFDFVERVRAARQASPDDAKRKFDSLFKDKK